MWNRIVLNVLITLSDYDFFFQIEVKGDLFVYDFDYHDDILYVFRI